MFCNVLNKLWRKRDGRQEPPLSIQSSRDAPWRQAGCNWEGGHRCQGDVGLSGLGIQADVVTQQPPVTEHSLCAGVTL